MNYNLPMPVYQLIDEHIFPNPELAETDGLLAVGGDLSPGRLLLAYSQGIFPWYSDDQPILWWSPNPRLVLIPNELKISRSLRQTIKRETFTVTVNTAFDEIIAQCAQVNAQKHGSTWITPEMLEAYKALHQMGAAHSVESWRGGELVGGLYGISMGAMFFGESMFSLQSNASKVAFAHLAQMLGVAGYELIDCQVDTSHLRGFGARDLPRSEFLDMLKGAINKPMPPHIWRQ